MINWPELFRTVLASKAPEDLDAGKFSLDEVDKIPKKKKQKLIIYKDRAKVRFACEDCHNAWTSMNGQIIMCFKLGAYSQTGIGTALFKTYGQACLLCENSDEARNTYFEVPNWYKDEAQRVIENFVGVILREIYKDETQEMKESSKLGRPRSKHNSELCEACTDGTCLKKKRRNPKSKKKNKNLNKIQCEE